MRKIDLISNLKKIMDFVIPAFMPVYTVSGMPASGSTFVYQVLYELGKKPRKIHEFTDDLSYKFITYRDPRDVICSQASRQFKYLKDSVGMEAALIQAHFHMFRARRFQDILRKYKEDKRAYFIRYEDFFIGREDELVKVILGKIGIKLNKDRISRISGKFSLEANMIRSKGYRDFEEYDKRLQVHGDHISSKGKIGVWQELFTGRVKDMVKRDLNDFLVELGYEKDDNW